MLIKLRDVLVVSHESSAGAPCDILFFIKMFQNVSEASSSEDRNSSSTRSGFIAWCRDSPSPITVCVYSKVAAWAGKAQSV